MPFIFLSLPSSLVLTTTVIKILNLQGWRTGQVGWTSSAWSWAERKQREGVGLSPGPWRGARQMYPSQQREACQGRRWCRRTTTTRDLEAGWKAALEEQPGAEEHGKKRNRRRGARKWTCYDFDDDVTAGQRQGWRRRVGSTWKTNTKIKILLEQKITVTAETWTKPQT